MHKCPKCGESLHDYEESCWNCGPAAAAAASAKAQAEIAPELKRSQMKKCPYCAEEILAEAIKCRHCGSDMPGFGSRAQPAKAPVKGPDEIRISKKSAIAIIAALAAIFILWAAFTFIKPLSGMMGQKADAAGDGLGRNVAYEEITEYDGKGGVKKSVKTYPQTKDKAK